MAMSCRAIAQDQYSMPMLRKTSDVALTSTPLRSSGVLALSTNPLRSSLSINAVTLPGVIPSDTAIREGGKAPCSSRFKQRRSLRDTKNSADHRRPVRCERIVEVISRCVTGVGRAEQTVSWRTVLDKSADTYVIEIVL